MKFPALAVFIVGLIALPVAAQQPAAAAKTEEKKPDDKKPEEKKDEAKDKPDEKPDKKVESRHSVIVGGQKVDYTATAGLISLKDAEGKQTAEIFYIAYTRDGQTDLTRRPVTFSFNGGPGSSSVWMHLGLLGPRRVKLNEDGSAVPPPYALVDNEFSLLDETDLVFIDPVSTGYSRAAKPDDAKKFHGLDGDVKSVADFIRLYVTKNKRWGSPKFVIGESYGTTRAAALSGELSNRYKMNVNGIMLVSTVLNFQTISFSEGNDLPYTLFLPGYTATAWYHKKLPGDLQNLSLKEAVARAEAFAQGEYSQALFQGAGLAAGKRAELVKSVARFTGLGEEFVDRANLRVSLNRFAAELLRNEKQVVGRFDGRYKGFIRDPLSSGMEYDPSGSAVMGNFGATFNHYVRTELNFEEDRPYEIIASVGPWNWGSENNFVNVADTLADSMTENPFLKVHVSNGYYDLATPQFASRYTFNHLNIAPALQKNITMDDYESGHMMYLNLPDLKKQKADLAKFIRSACGR
jgi:carboxypeptidase C (cathepsin A)